MALTVTYSVCICVCVCVHTHPYTWVFILTPTNRVIYSIIHIQALKNLPRLSLTAECFLYTVVLGITGKTPTKVVSLGRSKVRKYWVGSHKDWSLYVLLSGHLPTAPERGWPDLLARCACVWNHTAIRKILESNSSVSTTGKTPILKRQRNLQLKTTK